MVRVKRKYASAKEGARKNRTLGDSRDWKSSPRSRRKERPRERPKDREYRKSSNQNGLWLPKEIVELVQAKELKWIEAAVFGTIYAFSKTKLGCVASNQHLADCVGRSPESVRRILRTLEDLGYIDRVTIHHDNLSVSKGRGIRFLLEIEKHPEFSSQDGPRGMEGIPRKGLDVFRGARHFRSEIVALVTNGKINWTEAALLALIGNLSTKHPCNAGNHFLAKTIAVSESTVDADLTKLTDLGLVKRRRTSGRKLTVDWVACRDV